MSDDIEQDDILLQTPGQIIKLAREDKQISLSDVAERLMLSKQIIAAIEEDDYEKIPAQVYAEGYLRSYARFLDVPVDKVIKSFRHLEVYSDQVEKKRSQRDSDKSLRAPLKGKSGNSLVLAVFGFFILAILILFLIKNHWDNRHATGVQKPDDVVSEFTEDMSNTMLPIDTISVVESYIDSDSGKSKSSNDRVNAGEENFSEHLMLDVPSDSSRKKRN